MSSQQSWADRQRLMDLYYNAKQELSAVVRTNAPEPEVKK